MNVLCIRCKGRGFCGRQQCPHQLKLNSKVKVKDLLKSDSFDSASPAPFVGRFGYPNVNIGILAPPEKSEDTWLYDAPKYWANKNFQIPDIVDFRSSLINSRFNANVRVRNKFLEISQEVGMASLPVDLEFNLHQKPQFHLNADSTLAPTGPNAKLKQLEITSNPKIHTKVDKVNSDVDLKANEAILYLNKHGFDENFLSKMLSVGTIGVKKDRKLVPTRWSITATDDMLGKNLIKEIKDYKESEYFAYFGGYLGNYYLFLFFPEVWSYELFETYMPNASYNTSEEMAFTTDFESYDGRKNYASNTAGGYYTSRLAILEELSSMKRQSSVLSIRVITGEYSIPLGVWVTREASRKSLANKPLQFSSKELMLQYAENLVKTKFGFDLDKIINNSKLLKNISQQKKLTKFF